MGSFNFIGDIQVFRDKNNHILVKEVRSKRNGNDEYFDLNLCETIKLPEHVSRNNIIEVKGEEKRIAFGIYNYWKRLKNKDYVIQKTEFNFSKNKKTMQNNHSLRRDQTSIFNSDLQTTQAKQKIEHKTPKKNQKNTDQAVNRQLIFLDVISGQENIPSKIHRKAAIRHFVEKRKIKSLIHFTAVDNLESILEFGLLSRDKVEKLSNREKIRINDKVRKDFQKEAICLSIDFPNYRMFYKYRQKIKTSWVVISLKPDILWDFDCAFCHTNAADNSSRFIDIEKRKGILALEKLFEDSEQVERIKLKIPDNYPTDPQAEVLVFESIPIEYFLMINFYNFSERNYYAEKYEKYKNIFGIDLSYFRPRQDFPHWQNDNENYNTNNDILVIDDEIPF